MKKMTLITLLASLGLVVGFVGCDVNRGPAERTGERIDRAGERAGDAVEDAGDRVEDGVDDMKR